MLVAAFAAASDRADGEIDGTSRGNTWRALDAFRHERQLRSRGPATEEDWKALESDGSPTLVDYTLTEKDVKGPHQKGILTT